MVPNTRPRNSGADINTHVLAALSLASLSFICLLLVLVPGLNISYGKLNGSSFAVIDCSEVKVDIGGHTFRGLPDTFDYSKHKDFYAFYLWNYCSGRIHNGTYHVDFCSDGRHSLYDLFRYWKLWGASVHKEGTRFYWLEHGPRLLCIPYLVAGAVTGLGLLAGTRSHFSKKVSRTTLVLAAMAAISFVTTTLVAQVTYGQLISRADDEDISITARKVGHTVYIANWVGSISSILALALWYRLIATEVVHRAPTLDTQSHAHARTSAVSPISTQGFVESPVETFVRKRNLAAKYLSSAD